MIKVLSFVAVLLLAMTNIAVADQPLRERRTFDLDVRLNGASRFCGFEIRGHFTGSTSFTLFYDQDGNIIRETDTFPSLKATVYRPGTDLSYTSNESGKVEFYYTDGAALGSAVTIVSTGLVERIPGIGMETGREVSPGIVVGYDAAGIPLVAGPPPAPGTGQNFPLQPIGRDRCAFFQ